MAEVAQTAFAYKFGVKNWSSQIHDIMKIQLLAELELVVSSFPDLQGCPLRVSMKTWQDVCSALTKALISKVLTPAGFKWPLMALEACSGSGSLKLGEALYESLLHLSPLLLLPVAAHTYCSHNSTALRRQNHEFLREKLLKSDWYIFPHRIFTWNLPFHKVTTQILTAKFV